MSILDEAFPYGRAHSFLHDKEYIGLLASPPVVVRWTPGEAGAEADIDDQSAEVISRLRSEMPLVSTFLPSVEVPGMQKGMTVNLSLSHACTLNCSYCYRPTDHHASGRMTSKLARGAIDFAFECQLFEGMELSFGFSQTCEPLLHLEEIRELRDYIRIKAASEGRPAVPGRTFICNGTLITERVLANPAFAGNRLYLSMDGPEDMHDVARRDAHGRGSYTRVREAARLLLDRGLVIGSSAVLNGQDPRVLDVFLHHKELGFPLIGIKPVRLPHEHPLAINDSNIERVLSEYTRFVEYLMSLPEEHFLDCVLHLSPSDFFRRFVDRLIQRSVTAYRCPAVRTEISVDTDGTIYPCGSFTGKSEWCLGDIDGGIDEKLFRSFHTDAHVDNRPTCRDCWARYVCGGGCYYHSTIVNRSMFSPDLVKCRLVKHIIELAMVFTGHLHDRGTGILTMLGYADSGDSLPVYESHFSPLTASLSEPAPSRVQVMSLAEGYMIRKKAWRGPQDLSASLWIWWNERGLNLKADITDDVFFQPFDKTWFNAGDCLRFVCQNPLTGMLHEFGAALLSSGPGVFRTINGGLAEPAEPASVNVRRTGSQTKYALTIPWSEMQGPPSGGDSWPFSLVIVDNDRTSSGWMQWSSGLMPSVNAQAMGRISFQR